MSEVNKPKDDPKVVVSELEENNQDIDDSNIDVSNESVNVDGNADEFSSVGKVEDSMLRALQAYLSLQGKAFSLGALRDLGEPDEIEFTTKSAVQVLQQLGYRASFGELRVWRFKPAHLPLIAFKKQTGEAILVENTEEGSGYNVTVFSLESEVAVLERSELAELLNDYIILAREEPVRNKSSSWFWGSFSQSKWMYMQVLLAAALTNFLGLSTSLFIMVVYDRVVPNEAIESLIALTIGVTIALGFDFLIKTIRSQFVDRAGQKADGRMARLIFNKILNMRSDLKSQNSGALASVVREFDTLRDFFTSATLVAVVDLPFIFFFIWVIHLIAGPLALIPLIAVPVVIVIGLAIQPFLASVADGSMQTGMTKQSVLIETINGIDTIQATGSGRLMRKRFEDAANAQSELSLKNRVISQFAINSAASIQQFAQIATIFFGVFLIQDGIVTMGALIAAVILGGRTLAPLSQLASALSRANSARQAFRSLSNIMKEDESDELHLAKLSRPHLTGDIELKNLSYAFPSATADTVSDISIKIPAGQRVAIVGRMGCGKSTLMKLIAGLINPSSGAVMIDGIDVRQIDPSDLRRNVGVMLQDTWLFSGSVKQNVQMGHHEYSDEKVLSACKIAGVDDFISKNPLGYDLQLKERGEGLSGGQRQSINLARALLHDPNVLILDEPTSSMDQATELSVIQALNEWSREQKTLLMVTHRNSLLQLADRVLVIDAGSIIADTTPEKLRSQQNVRNK